MDLDAFKQNVRQITELSDSDCALFLPFLKQKYVSKGAFLFEAGGPANEIAYVQSGVLRMFYLTEEGKEINNHFFLEGDYATSYLDFLKDRESRYSIQALEDCELLTFDGAALNAAYDQSKNWERFGRIIAESVFATATNRFESFLFQSAKERYLSMLDNYPLFIKKIPLYHLASYIGVERESLSRIRKEIATENRM